MVLRKRLSLRIVEAVNAIPPVELVESEREISQVPNGIVDHDICVLGRSTRSIELCCTTSNKDETYLVLDECFNNQIWSKDWFGTRI